MKRIVELAEDYHKKTKSPVCIGLDVWIYEAGNREIKWDVWDGEDIVKFKSFQELTDYLVLMEEV